MEESCREGCYRDELCKKDAEVSCEQEIVITRGWSGEL